MDSSAELQHLPPVTPRLVEPPARGDHADTVAALAHAERLSGEHRYAEAIAVLGDVQIPSSSAPELALRVLFSEAWSRMYLGQLGAAVATLERARALAEGPSFTDLDRAEALFRLGCCRVKLSKISNAVALFTAALGLVDEGTVNGDRLRSRIFDWRSRCYQLQREWEAAQVDAERSLELAHSVGADRLVVLAKMQCSIVAERRGERLLARYYADGARTLAASIGDRQTEARLLNNLGGLSFLLGDPAEAVAFLTESFALSLEIGNLADAAQAVSSLAQVHLRCNAPQLAEEQARHALSILEGREDYRDERGNAHLVLGRALLMQERSDEAQAEFAAAEWLYEAIGSASHLAAAWTAQGDAYERDGDLEAAATLFRRAAESLQDFHF
jgi:tetratricopeptide (TPR) repeat protein